MNTIPGRTELRKDPTSGRWALVRTAEASVEIDGACPFCPGREAQIPPEIAAYRTNGQPPNSPDWLLRVIPEPRPLLQIEGNIQRDGHGIFDRVSGRGASELVIEHPEHRTAWDRLPGDAIERVLWMYRERLVDLYRDPQIRAVLILRREPAPADRITHSVSRVLGAPIVFDDLRQELTAARYYYAHKQRCLYCDILRQERQEGVRVVEETPRFLIYTPYGSRAPFETWLVPTTHRHCFGAAAPEELADLARALQAVFRRLHAVRPGAPVELKLHTAPNSRMQLRSNEWQSLSEDFHWHVELAPNGNEREEVGGFAVNPVPPEEAARLLRQVEKPSSEEIRLR